MKPISRRDMLNQAGLLGTAVAVALPLAQTAADPVPRQPPGAKPRLKVVTQTESRKRSACYAHASQAPDKFYALQELVTRMRGLESGHKQAEGYIRHVQSPDFALPMAS